MVSDKMSENRTDSISSLVQQYSQPSPLGFAKELAPVMYRAEFSGGKWQEGSLVPYEKILISPAATSLQFAQQIFEGMKAYLIEHESPHLFRPELNFHRLNRSANRLSMPSIDAEVFADSIHQLTDVLKDIIPGRPGQSLYLRPTVLGIDEQFAVQGSENFTYLLMASPSDPYFAQPIKVLIEREHCRAAVGGTGADKVGGNYAASLNSTLKCREMGFDQPLWLDPVSRKNIEELSGMNFFAMIDGRLATPSLSGSILPGVTRNSLIRLAAQLGLDPVEKTMPINELLKEIDRGSCTEAFASGTAAIVSPIAAIGEVEGDIFELPCTDDVASRLRMSLLDIQEGRSNDEFSWMVDASNQRELASRFLE
jgi:branched-chain amino acid aminotransferase